MEDLMSVPHPHQAPIASVAKLRAKPVRQSVHTSLLTNLTSCKNSDEMINHKFDTSPQISKFRDSVV